ncbi:MAG: hypothetical protein RLZZ59_570 [Pseudomonadota bacterium]|jgi:outer membrane protein assembly factor BamB
MRILMIFIVLLFFTGCGGRAHNIVSFTEPVKVDNQNLDIILPQRTSLVTWDRLNNDINIAFGGKDIDYRRVSLGLKYGISALPLIMDEKILFLTADGYLRAFSEKNNKSLWATNLIGKRTYSTYVGGGITYYKGKLIVTNGSKNLEIIDSEDGNVLFIKQFPGIIVSKPVLYNDIVILQTMDNQLFAFDLNRNAIIWQHQGDSELITSGNIVDPVVNSKGQVLISYTSGQVILVDIMSGRALWNIDLSVDNNMPEFMPVNIAVAPIIDSGYVYIADNNGKFYKLEEETGELIWTKSIDDVRSINNLPNVIIVTTNGRQVIALNKIDGNAVWTSDIGEIETSRSRWTTIEIVASLVIDDVLKIYTYEGGIYTIDPKNGRLIDRHKFIKGVNFMTITDKIRLFQGKNILVSKK